MVEIITAYAIGFVLGVLATILFGNSGVKIQKDDNRISNGHSNASNGVIHVQYADGEDLIITKEVREFRKDFNKYVNWKVKQSKQQ